MEVRRVVGVRRRSEEEDRQKGRNIRRRVGTERGQRKERMNR